MTTYAGLDGMRTAVVERLQTRMADYIAQYETELVLPAGTLSTQPIKPGDTGIVPRLVTKANRPSAVLDDFPALLVLAYGVLKTEFAGIEAPHPSDYVSGDPIQPNAMELRKTYRLRIYGYIKAQNYEDTSLARDRLEVCLQRCLSDEAQLGDNVKFDIGSYNSRLSDITNDPKSRSQTLGAWYSDIEVVSNERISAPALGVADTIEVDESLLADEN